MYFEFDLPRGRDGNIRLNYISDLKTESKYVIDAINELVDKITILEAELNDLKNN